jgi:hypothetical protein
MFVLKEQIFFLNLTFDFIGKSESDKSFCKKYRCVGNSFLTSVNFHGRFSFKLL